MAPGRTAVGDPRSVWADDLQLAVELSLGAATLTAELLDTEITIATKTRRSDLVTEADLRAEQLIVDGLRRARPEDTVDAEEGGRHHDGGGDRCWRIDPLDGTNNFAIGLPSYGNCISLVVRGQIVASVAHCAVGRRLVTAAADLPTHIDGTRYRPSWRNGEAVAFIQSYPSIGTVEAGELRMELERRFGRVLSTWSPVTDLVLLLTGGVGALVNLEPGGHDWDAVRFLAHRADAFVHTSGVVKGGSSPVEVIVDRRGDAVGLLDDLLDLGEETAASLHDGE